MFFQLLYIHLFRPFLKYNQQTSPLPTHVSPRKLCTQAAAMISKLLRLYKRSHGLRQICNIAVYIAHSACTIHLLNLPEKNAKRDIIHGVKHLEEIAEGWLCARRTLGILSVLAKRWKVELPEEAVTVLARTDAKFGPWGDVSTPKPAVLSPDQVLDEQQSPTQSSPALQPYSMSVSNAPTTFFDKHGNPIGSLTSEALHRASEARSLPPNDAHTLAYPRVQRHPPDTLNPSTPASTAARQSIDGTTSTTGNSPSQFYGGVDQLMRDSQDWWLRDQSQLAMGFDNWNFSPDDIASWFAGNQAGIGSPSQTNGFAASPATNGAAAGINGNANANGAVNGANVFGGALNAYNENEWYN